MPDALFGPPYEAIVESLLQAMADQRIRLPAARPQNMPLIIHPFLAAHLARQQSPPSELFSLKRNPLNCMLPKPKSINYAAAGLGIPSMGPDPVKLKTK
jgi:hypothetical protein